MTCATKMISGVMRVVDARTGKIAVSKFGHAMDGGRKNAKERGGVISRRQVRHINESNHKGK